MIYQKVATQEEAQARTCVIWDIKSCPVPSKWDAYRLGPCFKRDLKNLGYSEVLEITAIGHLLDVPEDILQSLSFSEICLYHIPFDVVNILKAMLEWGHKYQPPVNILLISARDFSDGLEYLKMKGFNILPQIEAFPTSTTLESLWKTIVEDAMDTVEEVQEMPSKTMEFSWLCGVCRDVAGCARTGIDFEIFIRHLRSQKHRERMLMLLPYDYKLRRAVDEEEVNASFHATSIMLNNKTVKKALTQVEAVARTMVIWDMKSCPVPSRYADRVGPCIKRALKKSGYSGHVTITAVGHLIDFPDDVLRAVSSTGISLNHIPFDVLDVWHAMIDWGGDNQPPANILLISAREYSDSLKYLERKGFNILRQILYNDSLGVFPPTTSMENLWENFVTDTMDAEEKYSETSEGDWLCSVCDDDHFEGLAGKGFENLTEHLWSLEHRKRMLGYLRCSYKLKSDEDEEEVKAFRRNLRLLLGRKRKNPEWKEEDDNMALAEMLCWVDE